MSARSARTLHALVLLPSWISLRRTRLLRTPLQVSLHRTLNATCVRSSRTCRMPLAERIEPRSSEWSRRSSVCVTTRTVYAWLDGEWRALSLQNTQLHDGPIVSDNYDGVLGGYQLSSGRLFTVTRVGGFWLRRLPTRTKCRCSKLPKAGSSVLAASLCTRCRRMQTAG
jgi:hypothetical protein